MRLLIDLTTDRDGRPVGTFAVAGEHRAVEFADWLDLLRLLERCIDTSPSSRRTDDGRRRRPEA